MNDLEAIVDSLLDNQDIHINWSKIVDSDEDVVINKLKCNDLTRKEIPSHLVDICRFYDKLEPLTNEEKEIFYEMTAGLAVRQVYSSDMSLGQDGFAEGLKEYGEYLILSYLGWRIGLNPNAKGDFKRLDGTKDFDEFFMLKDDDVEIIYEPFDHYANEKYRTLLDIIEYETTVVSRMKNLNLAKPFNKWINETVHIFEETKKHYNEENYIDSYIKYYEGFKRMHDLYFTIPFHNYMDDWDPNSK